MAEDDKNIWVDSTFISPGVKEEDVATEYITADADVIGSYAMPVIYNVEDSNSAVIEPTVEYSICTAVSLINKILNEVSLSPGAAYSNSAPVPILYTAPTTQMSGTKELDISYVTGYTLVSGAINSKIDYISGNEYEFTFNVPVNWYRPTSISGSFDTWTNYTNFSGNLTSQDIPIPVSSGIFNYTTEFVSYGLIGNSVLDSTMDISFAGWVDYPVVADVFSVIHNIECGYNTSATIINGGVLPHTIDTFSSDEDAFVIELDLFCSLLDFCSKEIDVALTSGTIEFLNTDTFSTDLDKKPITCDVKLHPLKITNFSLDVGEHTTASGYIAVDIVDDTCSVSTSGTYFEVDGQVVQSTFSGIANGYRMFYDPIDNFEFLNGPTVFTVHAENTCGSYLEKELYLTFGYIVRYYNFSDYGIDYGFNNKVAVRITAENMVSCPHIDSVSYTFDSAQLNNREIGASIFCVKHGDDATNISASIYPLSTAYFYDKEIEVVVNAKDFAGNEMPSFVLRYKIESQQ